jgi:hypothetical protein
MLTVTSSGLGGAIISGKFIFEAQRREGAKVAEFVRIGS